MRLVILGTSGVCKQMDELIRNQIDSISIDTFSSIEEFVDNTNIRTSKYDRMLLVSNVIPKALPKDQKQSRLYGLLEYINAKLPEIRIITMCRDANDYEMYRFVFSAPIYANLNISKGLNAHLIISSVENDVAQLKAQYEGKDDLGVQVIQQTVQQEHEKVEEKQVKKKGNIFSKLFGGGKKKKESEPPKASTQGVDLPQKEIEETSDSDGTLTDEDIDNLVADVTDIDSVSDTTEVVSSSISAEKYTEATQTPSINKKKKKKRVEPEVNINLDQPMGVKYEAPKNASYNTDVVYNGDTNPMGYNQGVFNQPPVTPVTPVTPVAPATPVTPITPATPVAPAAPVTPITPVAPVTPATPVAPAAPASSGADIYGGQVTGQQGSRNYTSPIGSTPKPKKFTADSIDDLDFSLDDSPKVTIDDEETEETKVGVSLQDNRKEEKPVLPVVTPTPRPSKVSQVDASKIEQHKFNVEDTNDKKLNIDSSGHQDGVTGVRLTQGINTQTEEEDDFEAAFVKKSYSRRAPSSFGDISSLPSFDDINLNSENDDVEEAVDDDEINIVPVDPALLNAQQAQASQPKVIEKVVERVVEKPVEVIKEVEKIVEKPVERVVEKEVVKEKMIYVAGGSSSVHHLKDILAAQEPTYLLITGDRRSSITTTSLSLANIFGSKLRTLYVDLDTKNHGSLVRLGIQNIVDEDESVQNGLKNIRTPKVLENIVYWGNNVFASLISMFGTDVSDSEITRAANVLAVQHSFNVVVIDCPLDKLCLLDDLLPICDTIICIDGSVQGIMNTMSELSELTENGVSKKVQNMMYRSSRILVTGKDADAKMFNENRKFVDDIFSLSDEPIPWIKTPVMGTLNNLVKAVKNM